MITPRGSGNWYTGIHTPLVQSELYQKVQEGLEKYKVNRSNTKEFAFTKLMTCGLCGSGITAEEKYKKLSDGNIAKYIYYGCTRSKDPKCKCGYIREEEIIKQIIDIIDKVSLDELGIKNKLEQEIDRYHQFRHDVFGIAKKDITLNKEFDMKKYAKYILVDGNIAEKHELLSCLRSRLTLTERKLKLTN